MVPFTVLHYVGAEEDRGGILTMVRTLVSAGLGRGIVWVAPKFRATRTPELHWLRKDGPPAETINAAALWSAARVAWRLRRAIERRRRIFHGHSRAGLLVGLWLRLFGANRVVVSVHCHGRQTWFYRWASLVLGGRLVWLTPAMKRHYDVGGWNWRGCQRNFLSSEGEATDENEAFAGKVYGRTLRSEGTPPTSSDVRRGCHQRPSEEPTLIDDARLEKETSNWILRFAQNDRAGGGGARCLRLGGIGALVPWKGWHLVIEALAKLPSAERGKVKFSHIGSAENSSESRAYAAELRRRSEELGVTEAIVWRGEERSSAALLAEIDVLVVPSVGEPFSLALLEAWRAGVPVLAADDGGPAELISEGRDGWLFTSGSSAALAGKIVELLLLPNESWKTVKPQLPSAEPAVTSWREIYAEGLA